MSQDDRVDAASGRESASRWAGESAGPAAVIGASAARIATGVAATFEREMEAGHGFLWLPVAFACGVLVYFALPGEPWLPALALGATGLAIAAAWRRADAPAFRVLVMIAAAAAGATAAKVRTDLVATPVLTREATVTAVGWISVREEASGGAARIQLRVHEIVDPAIPPPPTTVRITVRSGADGLHTGDAISVRARLRPPGGPAMPGGYDFSRAAYYEGIGAIGFAYGAAAPTDIGLAPADIRMWRPLEALRDTIRRRIEAALPGDAGHVATALVIGDKGGIAESTQEAMRASGLAHILAISGLHMALVAGSAFWLIRALLALSPTLALTRPIKKWAAGGALAVATFYLGISGANVATQRAYVMLAIMLVAILVDRRAITLRNVALAALLIMAFNPESVLTVSFQMSFAATIALVSGYEAIAVWRDKRVDLADRRERGPWTRIGSYAAGLFLTSLIAGLATAPFGAFHFQRVAPLTLLANLAAMPAVGLIVMPMAFLAVLAMPLGLEWAPLTAMSWGLSWVKLVAETTTAWSAGYGGVRMAPALSLVLVVGGFLWLALWRERWRLAGIVPIILAAPIALLAPRPAVIIDADAKAVAVRSQDDRLAILGGKGANFEVENWLRADGDVRLPGALDLKDGTACDALGCIGRAEGVGMVGLVSRREAFGEDCRAAIVVASALPAPEGCDRRAIVIDRAMLDRFGSHAIFVDDAGTLRVETAYPDRRRPFMTGR